MKQSSTAQDESRHLLPPLDPADNNPHLSADALLESVWSVSMATHSLENPPPSSGRSRAVSRRQTRAENSAVMLSFNFQASELFTREMLILLKP